MSRLPFFAVNWIYGQFLEHPALQALLPNRLLERRMTSLLPHYYINSDPQSADYGKVKAKLVWQDPNNGSQFQVRIDTAEMGIR